MTCNCIGGNPCPCQRAGLLIGRIEFGPQYTAAGPVVPTEMVEFVQSGPITGQDTLPAVLNREYVKGWNDALDNAIAALERSGDDRVRRWQGTELENDAKSRAWDALVCAAIIRKLKQNSPSAALHESKEKP